MPSEQIDDIVQVTIDIKSSALSLPGFGVPMILVQHTHWSERLRYYTDPDDMLTDGFASSDMAYVMAVAICSQEPRPERFAIGKRAAPGAQVITLSFTAVNTHDYTVTIFDGLTTYVIPPFTSDGSATLAEIATGVAGVINGTAVAVTAAAVGNQVTLTADNAGIPFVVSGLDADTTQASTTPNVGIPEDLAAIIDEQPDWYALLIPQRSILEIMTAAAQIETMQRIFVCQSNDSEILATVYNPSDTTTDIASRLKGRAYTRTALFYHPTDTDALDAAVVGKCIPKVPGSATWKFKELAGVTSTYLTNTQRTNLKSKNANGYRPVAGRSITYEGTAASGRFIDITHGTDKLHSRMQELTLGTLLANDKVDFTDEDFQKIVAAMRTALEESVAAHLLAKSRKLQDGTIKTPGYTISPPLVADIDPSDREAREIPESHQFEFDAPYAGGLHKVRMHGTLSF